MLLSLGIIAQSPSQGDNIVVAERTQARLSRRTPLRSKLTEGGGPGGLGGLIMGAAGGGLGGIAAAAGAGAAGGVLISKGNDIKLQQGTILRIRFERPVKLPSSDVASSQPLTLNE